MSFSDWVDESQQRFDEQPATAATAASLREFCTGALDRLLWSVVGCLGGPAYTTYLAGEQVHYFVDSHKELRRARDAIAEGAVLEWLMGPVDETTVFWDVGAYHGTYSIIAAVRGAPTVAFEPHPENMGRLSRNAVLNDVTIDQYDVALSDEATTRWFGTGQTPTSELRIHDSGDREVETVRGDTIRPKPDVVKIDVEGHEAAVLDGMADALESVKRIVVEVHEGVEPAGIARRLKHAGLATTEIETTRSQTYIGGTRGDES